VQERASLSPGRELVVLDLAVRTVNDLPEGGSVRFQLYRDEPPFFNQGSEDPFLECTVSGTSGPDDRACGAPGPFPLPPASTIFVRLSIVGGTAAASNPGQVRWGITVEPAG
jgi:hypothetical protein